MRADQLMIGDWVQHQEGACIVTGIVGDGIYFKDSISRGAISFDRIEPIPLTKEILEKNGFNLTDVKEFARLDFPEGKFVMRAMYDKDSGKQKGWGFFAFNVLSIVDYVHELQHALKICGIDKQIIL